MKYLKYGSLHARVKPLTLAYFTGRRYHIFFNPESDNENNIMKVGAPFAFGVAAMMGLRMVASSSPVVDSTTVVVLDDAAADAEVRT